jgi:predicted nucleic-acid-binding Zn-ribbon protein
MNELSSMLTKERSQSSQFITLFRGINMSMKKCPKCGSTDIDEGAISLGGRYISKQKKVLSVGMLYKTFACLNCGYLEDYIDADDLKKRLKK